MSNVELKLYLNSRKRKKEPIDETDRERLLELAKVRSELTKKLRTKKNK